MQFPLENRFAGLEDNELASIAVDVMANPLTLETPLDTRNFLIAVATRLQASFVT